MTTNSEHDHSNFLRENAASEAATQPADNPDADHTDEAHPAYWRGFDAGTAKFNLMCTDILDGKDVRESVDFEGPHSVLIERLKGLVNAQPTPDVAVACKRCESGVCSAHRPTPYVAALVEEARVIAELRAERDEALSELVRIQAAVGDGVQTPTTYLKYMLELRKVGAERDAAITRAEQAERERDALYGEAREPKNFHRYTAVELFLKEKYSDSLAMIANVANERDAAERDRATLTPILDGEITEGDWHAKTMRVSYAVDGRITIGATLREFLAAGGTIRVVKP